MPTVKLEEPLEFFIDRSLGRYAIAQALRDLGIGNIITMAEFYGEELAQQLLDVEWLQDIEIHKWVVLTKDRQMMRRQSRGSPNPELAKLAAVHARVFCVMGQQLSADEQITRLRKHAKGICSVARSRPGPYAYGIYAEEMREIWRPS